MSTTPIAEHALLSDCHSSALVDSSGSVEWLTFPRFDSPSVMARFLDDAAGHWAIRPVGHFEATRRYLEGTMVLETTFTSAAGRDIGSEGSAIPGQREPVQPAGTPAGERT